MSGEDFKEYAQFAAQLDPTHPARHAAQRAAVGELPADVAPNARRDKRQRVLADELRKLDAYETRFVRAFHKWDNQRRRVQSLERSLDKEFGK